MAPRINGYCPRCNAKARHRRDWLFLEERTNLFTDRLRLLHVSPKYAISRRLVRMPTLDYVAIDLEVRPHITALADLQHLPLRSDTFDAAICIHVLEHVADDRSAIDELYRVLKPGGWALISVPIRLDQGTYEDATINAPAARKAAFGETSHLRWYGIDFVDRLTAAGFVVTMDPATDIDPEPAERYGLLEDENVFVAVKPG
jgi:SAM-dependent methyltransferase